MSEFSDADYAYMRRCLLDMGDPWENSLGKVCCNCNAWVSQCVCGECDPIDEEELDRLLQFGTTLKGYEA